jgi:hypothetical protein
VRTHYATHPLRSKPEPAIPKLARELRIGLRNGDRRLRSIGSTRGDPDLFRGLRSIGPSVSNIDNPDLSLPGQIIVK